MATDTERAWAAGFFDGEGCTCYVNAGDKGRMIVMSVGQTSNTGSPPEVLVKFRDIVGGKIYGPIQQKVHWTPKYTWQVTGKSNVAAVYDVMAPYLGIVKKEQYERCMKSFDEHPMTLGTGMCRSGLHKMECDNVATQTVKGKTTRYCRECKRAADTYKPEYRRLIRAVVRNVESHTPLPPLPRMRVPS